MMPLTADDLFRLRFLRSAKFSPSGELIATTVSRVEGETERVELFIGPADAPLAPILIAGATRVETPVWSPDGRYVAIVTDGRLRMVDVASHSTSEPLTTDELTVADEPSWSPDSRRIAVSLIRHSEPLATRVITNFSFKAEGRGFVDGIDQGVFEILIDDGSARRLVPADLGLSMAPRWNPISSEVMFFSTFEPVPFASYSPSLGVVDAGTGDIRELLTPDHWFVTDARWTPDGRRIVMVADRDSDLPIPYTRVWVMDRLGDNLSERTPGVLAQPEVAAHHDMPAWDLTSNQLVVPTNSEAFVTHQVGGDGEIWRVGLDHEPASSPVLQGPRSCIILDAHRESGTLLYAVSSLHSPTELWISSMDGRDERRLTRLNDEVLLDWPEVDVEPYLAVSPDGLVVESWFMRPKGTTGPLPTILYIHGGPYAATGNIFRYDSFLLASQGWGVAFGNFRGSAGYGTDHMRGIVGDWGAKGFPDHMAVVDRAIELGFSDPDRLGVWGASHGGFATLWVVTHTQRFRAAIAESAIGNWETAYYLSDMPEGVVLEMGGTPLERPEDYRRRSPLTYVGQCNTPTMLIHGEDDLRCPITEAEQTFRALIEVGCPTELVRLANSDHLGDSMGPIAARRGQNAALLRWFRAHL